MLNKTPIATRSKNTDKPSSLCREAKIIAEAKIPINGPNFENAVSISPLKVHSSATPTAK